MIRYREHDLAVTMNDLQISEVIIPFGKKEIQTKVCCPNSDTLTDYAVILTHGASGNMDHSHLIALSNYLTQKGFLCLRFTYRSPKVENRMLAYKAVVEFLQTSKEYTLKGCFVAGRSMGARAAVMLANVMSSKDFVCGVICLSYPLHPPSKLSNLRKDILIQLKTPTLFLSGTKDSFATKALFDSVLNELTCEHEMTWIDGGDHGLKVKGQQSEEIINEMCHDVWRWCVTRIAHIPASSGTMKKLGNKDVRDVKGSEMKSLKRKREMKADKSRTSKKRM
ncbi:testis-expressed protein 30-like [Glandiceps talaboti]